MNPSVNETTVTIRGTPYQLRTDMSKETLAQLADYVNGKMQELDPKGVLPPGKVSVLASLSIASDLLEERSQSLGKRADLVQRLERLHDLLDAALEG